MRQFALPDLKSLRAIEGFRGSVRSLKWSPDNKMLAAGSTDRVLRIWSAVDLSRTITLDPHEYWFRTASWSYDGRFVAAGTNNRTVVVFSCDSAQPSASFEGLPEVGGKADGKDQRLVEKKGERLEEWVRCIAWAPNRPLAAFGADDYTVRVVDITNATVTELVSQQDERVQISPEPVSVVAWSPDGTKLASGWGRRIVVSNVLGAKTKRWSFFRQHSAEFTALEWSKDNNFIASADTNGGLLLWKPSRLWRTKGLSPVPERTLQRLEDMPLCLSFSPDGKFLCVGCDSGAVKICDTVYGSDVATVQIGEAIKSIEWAANPNVVIAATREGSVALIQPIRWTPVVSRQLLPRTHVSLGLHSFRVVAQHPAQVHPDLLIAAYDIDVAENGSLSLLVENSNVPSSASVGSS